VTDVGRKKSCITEVLRAKRRFSELKGGSQRVESVYECENAKKDVNQLPVLAPPLKLQRKRCT
jgi:hypothetical protein